MSLSDFWNAPGPFEPPSRAPRPDTLRFADTNGALGAGVEDSFLVEYLPWTVRRQVPAGSTSDGLTNLAAVEILAVTSLADLSPLPNHCPLKLRRNSEHLQNESGVSVVTDLCSANPCSITALGTPARCRPNPLDTPRLALAYPGIFWNTDGGGAGTGCNFLARARVIRSGLPKTPPGTHMAASEFEAPTPSSGCVPLGGHLKTARRWHLKTGQRGRSRTSLTYTLPSPLVPRFLWRCAGKRLILTSPGRRIRRRRDATGAPTQRPEWQGGTSRPKESAPFWRQSDKSQDYPLRGFAAGNAADRQKLLESRHPSAHRSVQPAWPNG